MEHGQVYKNTEDDTLWIFQHYIVLSGIPLFKKQDDPNVELQAFPLSKIKNFVLQD